MSTPASLPVLTFSSPLADALSRFLAFKRAAGCRYVDEARALRLLDQFLTTSLDADAPVITLDVVRRYGRTPGRGIGDHARAPTQPDPSGLPLSRARAGTEGTTGGTRQVRLTPIPSVNALRKDWRLLPCGLHGDA